MLDVRRMNRCRTFAVLFDWRSRIERRVDPNTNLSDLIDSNVELEPGLSLITHKLRINYYA